MIIIPALILLIRRGVKIWRVNELARYRLRRRHQLGYGWLAILEAFKREWIWRLYSGPMPVDTEALATKLACSEDVQA